MLQKIHYFRSNVMKCNAIEIIKGTLISIIVRVDLVRKGVGFSES